MTAAARTATMLSGAGIHMLPTPAPSALDTVVKQFTRAARSAEVLDARLHRYGGMEVGKFGGTKLAEGLDRLANKASWGALTAAKNADSVPLPKSLLDDIFSDGLQARRRAGEIESVGRYADLNFTLNLTHTPQEITEARVHLETALDLLGHPYQPMGVR